MAKCIMLQELEKQPDKWFTVKELAELLNISVGAIRNKMRIPIKLNWVYHKDKMVEHSHLKTKAGFTWALAIKHKEDEDEEM